MMSVSELRANVHPSAAAPLRCRGRWHRSAPRTGRPGSWNRRRPGRLVAGEAVADDKATASSIHAIALGRRSVTSVADPAASRPAATAGRRGAAETSSVARARSRRGLLVALAMLTRGRQLGDQLGQGAEIPSSPANPQLASRLPDPLADAEKDEGAQTRGSRCTRVGVLDKKSIRIRRSPLSAGPGPDPSTPAGCPR